MTVTWASVASNAELKSARMKDKGNLVCTFELIWCLIVLKCKFEECISGLRVDLFRDNNF